MALFTDAAIVTLDDLLQFEASLVQVASAHGINVESKINLATAGIGDKLTLWLLEAGESDPQSSSRRVIGLSTVVATPALQRWLCFESLARVYAEAYNVQLNTRFQGKWTEYQRESKTASELFFATGIEIVSTALPKPAMPLIALQNGSGPAQSIFVETSWVAGDGAESAPSPANGAVLPANSTIAVAMAEGAINAPLPAVGWNIYAGSQANNLTMQNSVPLAIGLTWQLPPFGLQVGAAPGKGQRPSYRIALSKQIRRG